MEKYKELRLVLKYNFKKRDWILNCSDKYGHLESADENSLLVGHIDNDNDSLQHPKQQIWLVLTQFERGLVR